MEARTQQKPGRPGADGTYAVMEHFYTLQGEGHWTGAAAYFIRLGGCDVGCHWCDVKESWPTEGHPVLAATNLAHIANASGAPFAVVTGGEPLMHDCGPLVAALHAQGLRAHIETSGAHPISGQWDWLTLSPKKFKPALPCAFAAARELKVVVNHPSDFPWAETLAEQVGPQTLLLLQPQWFRPESNAWVAQYVKQHPRWRASLQSHKYWGIP